MIFVFINIEDSWLYVYGYFLIEILVENKIEYLVFCLCEYKSKIEILYIINFMEIMYCKKIFKYLEFNI